MGVSRCRGLDEHLHATRRPAARDGEEDAGLAQALHGGDGGVGEDLVVGDQRPVHVGQQEPDGQGRSGCAMSDDGRRRRRRAAYPGPIAEPGYTPSHGPRPASPTVIVTCSTATSLTLATAGEDGYPQLSEVWFVAEGDQVAMSLNTPRQKVKNLETEPACTVFLLDLPNPYRYLEIRGTAVVAPDDDRAFAEQGRGQVRCRPARARRARRSPRHRADRPGRGHGGRDGAAEGPAAGPSAARPGRGGRRSGILRSVLTAPTICSCPSPSPGRCATP